MRKAHPEAPNPVDLPRALARLGLPPANRLDDRLARQVVDKLGLHIEDTCPGDLLTRLHVRSDLVRTATAALLEQFPDLARNIDRRTGGRNLQPMHVRLQRLLAALPVEQQRAGLVVEDLRCQLRGYYKPTASAREVAGGLRHLGFVQVRCWRVSEDGFRTRWYPADVAEAQHELLLAQRREARRAARSPKPAPTTNGSNTAAIAARERIDHQHAHQEHAR